VSILIPAGTYRLTRQLDYNYWLNPDGSAPDFSDGTVELVGAGEGQTVIDGQDRTRVFYLRTRAGKVTMRDLTIAPGPHLRAAARAGRRGSRARHLARGPAHPGPGHSPQKQGARGPRPVRRLGQKTGRPGPADSSDRQPPRRDHRRQSRDDDPLRLRRRRRR